MLNIRLARAGRKRDAHFRVVVSDSAHGRVGRILETVGHYHPRMPNDAEGRIHLDRSRARYWIERGARPSDTVRSFLKSLPEEAPPEESAEAPSPAAEAAEVATESAETAESAESAPETPTETASAEAAPAETSTEASAEAPSEEPAAG